MTRIHPTIAIINESTIVTDAEIGGVAHALSVQVHRDFAPAWGIAAAIQVFPKGVKPPAGSWWLVYLDTSDEAGALGYHDLTPEGLPLGKVFAGTDRKYGLSHSVTASHELLEMLGDPLINLTVQSSDGGGFYAYENCDAVEADGDGYEIADVAVSDFVYPRFFAPNAAGGRFDHGGLLNEPFQILPGGYLSYWTSSHGWTQLHGEAPKPGDRPRVGSRRERRRTPRDQWLVSTAHA